MHTLRLLLVGILFAPIMALSTAAQSDQSEIRNLLESRDTEIKQLISVDLSDEVRSKLVNVVNGIIDFNTMSSFALGEHWDGLTAEQKSNFSETFAQIVRNQSLENLDIYKSKVVYDNIEVAGNDALVQTSTVYKDVPAKVNYKMSKASGEWMITDIVLDEVSTADGYARSFQSVVRRKGFDTLMSSLNKKLAKQKSSA